MIDDKLFYFGSEGKLHTGWKESAGAKYYLNDEGKLGEIGKAVSGWKPIEGKRYHFGADGQMSVGESDISGEVYYFKETGEQILGFIPLGEGAGRYYYEKEDGIDKWGQPVKNTQFHNRYYTPDGLTSPSIESAAAVLDQIGWDIYAAYTWSSNLPYSGKTLYLEQMGSELLARQGFLNHTGNCYVMSATFYMMAKCMGYDAHQLAGGIPLARGGLSNHSWVEIEEDGEIIVYDLSAKRYHFRYGTPGTWRYD